jgi:uncharacterized protein
MGQREAAEIAREFAKLACGAMDVKKVILFGSHARDAATEDSDIDIAVVVNRIQGDFLKAISVLYKLRHQVDERIEPVLIEEGDDPSGFYDEITRTGQVMYSAA